jgi:uncharacterized repeat protein (TIGR02543 family)
MAALLFLMGAVESAAAATYYVDVDSRGGPSSDTNPGTIDRPFKTIEKARDTIRALGTDGHTVYIRGGTYRLTSALTFDARDSGSAGAPNVYRSYPGEQPVVSGGRLLTATWTVYSGNIWRCNVGSLRFNSLFVDGARATRAREPDGTYYTTQTPAGGQNWFTFSGTDIKASWTHLTDVEIVYLSDYTSPRMRIASVSGQTCTLEGNAAYQFWATNRYYVENVFEGLDTAGEWYLDKTSGDLYYYPIGGKNPNTSEIVVPVVGSTAINYQGYLLNCQGTSTSYVQYLEFRGLQFLHADWYIPTGGNEGWSEFLESCNATRATPNWWGLGPGVMLRGVRNCVFANNTVSHIGGNGIIIYGDNVTVDNCIVSDIGATGIKQGAASGGDSGAVASSHHNTIRGNTVHDCGVVFPFGDGIMSLIGNNHLITHNLVYNAAFFGINTGRAQAYGGDNTNNTVSYNEVHHVTTHLGDSAAIYFCGTQTGSVAHHNKVHDCASLYSAIYPYRNTGGYAFYIDENASGITIRDNWIYRVNVGLRINGSVSDAFTNNVLATLDYAFVFCNGSPGTTITKNIFYNTTSTPVNIYSSISAVGAGNANYNDLYNTLSGFQTTWNNWITQGRSYSLDLNSITSDPLFVSFSNDNLHLQTASRALLAQGSGGIGFQEIDMSTVGPQTSSYTITASAGTGGSITPSGTVSVAQGGSQTFTIQANTGYSLSSVQVDGVSVGAVSSYTFTNVVANHTISAAFAAAPAASYTLNVTATNGSVAKTPNQTSYTSGQSVSLQATPNTGYNFTGWSGDLTGTGNPATLVINSNKSVTASFAANTYTLTIIATNGSVTKTPNAASYSYGQVVTLQAVPNTGYTFAGWSGDASGTSTTTTVTMTTNKTITANFTAIPVTYTVSISATNGSVTKTPDQASYMSGQTVTLQATPSASYTFAGWSGDLTGTTNPATLVMNSNKAVAANFTAVVVTYTLGISAANGTVTKTPDKTSYASGETVTLQAVPNAGYKFVSWSGDLSGTANPTTLMMNSNKSVTASFVANTYTLSVTAANGTVTKTPDKTSYTSGETVTLQAVPNAGYKFVGWSGDLTGTANPATLVMNSNKSVTASFAADTYTLTINATNGTVTRNPDKAGYAYGEVVTLQAMPNQGYTFSGWSGDASGTSSSTTVTMNANKTVTAGFTSAGADQSPPVLGNCSPAPDSIQAPPNTLVTLHLSDDGQGVDPASVSITVDEKLVYSGDADLQRTAYGVCYRSGTKADYTYIYQRRDLYGDSREVAVKVGARDLAGNLMPEQTYSFATEMYAFGRSRNALTDQSNLNQGRPVTMSDTRGNIWIMWQAGNAGTRHIYAARFMPDTDTYNPTLQLSRSTGDHCNPVVAMDSAGTLYAAWQENARGVWDVYLSTSADGTTWSAPKRIVDPAAPANPPFNQTNPALAASQQASRLVAIAWQDDRTGNQDIYVARSTNAFATSTASRVTSDGASQSDPAVAIDGQDTIFVLWTDARNGATDIYGAASNSGPWTNVPVVTAPGNQSQPLVAAATTDALLHIVWVDDGGGNLDVFYTAAPGLPASPVTGTNIIDDTSKADQQAPALAVAARADGTDGVFACWQDSRNVALSGDTDLYFADLSSGSVSTNVLVDDKGTNSNQSEVALAVNGNGYPYLVWSDDAGKKLQVYYSGATYMDPVPLAKKEIVATAGDTIGTPPQNIKALDDVSVVIPAQACPFNATIGIRRIRNPQGYATESLRIYDFGPSGLTFSQPVTITIPYPTRGTGKVRAYWFNSATSAFTDQGVTNVQDITVASGLHALRFNTTHFTPYLVVEEVPGTTGGSGGGCSLTVGGEDDVAGYFAPYLLLAAVVLALRLTDRRRRLTARREDDCHT